MQTIPKYLFDKLLETDNPLKNFCLFLVDVSGKILDYTGAIEFYTSSALQIGDNITHRLYFTEGLFPFRENELKLTQLQIKDGHFTDVLILKGEENTVWVSLFDVTDPALHYQKLLQEHNEMMFNHEQNAVKYALSYLELIDVVIFKRLEQSKYQVVGSVPDWLMQLKPQLKGLVNDKLVEAFPYLDTFEIEADNFWSDKKQGKYPSEIWIENDVAGKEYYLKAIALNYNKNSYLALMRVNEDLAVGQDVYQKARELELAYEKLAKAEARLKELLEYKEKFVSIITHDLRSPIASVYGIAEMLINDEDLKMRLDQFYREMLMGIKSEMERLLDYNDKLYHWSNLELGNFKLKIEEISVHKLAEMVSRTAIHAIEAKHLKFKTDIPYDLTIKVDITLFLQALNNLVTNAIKFTPENGEVGIKAGRDTEGNPYITIYDTGIGMGKGTVSQLFKTQTTSRGTKGEMGSGLGLGIIKKVIDAHGFNITATSEAGKGSQFTINLRAM